MMTFVIGCCILHTLYMRLFLCVMLAIVFEKSLIRVRQYFCSIFATTISHASHKLFNVIINWSLGYMKLNIRLVLPVASQTDPIFPSCSVQCSVCVCVGLTLWCLMRGRSCNRSKVVNISADMRDWCAIRYDTRSPWFYFYSRWIGSMSCRSKIVKTSQKKKPESSNTLKWYLIDVIHLFWGWHTLVVHLQWVLSSFAVVGSVAHIKMISLPLRAPLVCNVHDCLYTSLGMPSTHAAVFGPEGIFRCDVHRTSNTRNDWTVVVVIWLCSWSLSHFARLKF